jgi:putative NIF3 family GTP cyclohydrolase 1 type 2
MEAKKLYESLDKEFELDKLQEDEWSFFDLGDYVTEGFKKTRMGLVLDNAKEIKKVYTAVFPSERVLDHILATEERNVLLFTHHPMIWEPGEGGFPFRNIPERYLEFLKEREISYYSIHVPLDKNGPYSTTTSLARALEIETEREFFDYFGVMVGIIGQTKWTSIFDLNKQVEETVGHVLKTWVNGPPEIPDGRVALVAGGGNDPDVAQELADAGIKAYVTGVTYKNPEWEPGLKFHEICNENKINVIAATHYSTEKFACMAVREFFDKLGVPSEFIDDEPDFNDY